MIRFAKGDPMKVLMATAIVAAAVSLNGDGTTTTLICCSAFVPIYKKLDMKLMNLGFLLSYKTLSWTYYHGADLLLVQCQFLV